MAKRAASPAKTKAATLGQRDLFALLKSCRSGDVAAVRKRLKEGVDANAMHEGTGKHLLSAASKAGQAKVVKVLLDAGADPNRADTWKAMPPGGTPLENACESGSLDVVKLLVASGADINRKGLRTPIWTAASHQHPEVVRYLLERGATHDASTFWKAVWAEKAETVELLLAAGGSAFVNDRSDDGETPLHLAASRETPDVAMVLMRAGADVNAASTSFKETPLHIAGKSGRLATIRVLVEAGAELDALNHKKQTPEQWARGYGKAEAAALLKELRRGAGTSARGVKGTSRPRSKA